MKRARWLPVLAIGAFASPLLPELAGARLLAFRDAFITHFPIQTFSLALERSGQVPFLNFGASNVEPLLANPNTVTLYPTHLLFHLLPAAAAFNLHLLLHVVWAFFGAAALSRRLGAGRRAAWIGGTAYAFSGPFLSYGAAFANAAAAAAWAPWAISEAVRLGRANRTRDSRRGTRATLALGIALGLQILAGEPAISAWTGVAVAAASIAASRRSILRLAGAGIASAVIAAAIAAPQILSTAAAIPYSFRGEHLFSRAQFDAAANLPLRALETLFPLLFGEPRPMVSGAFWGYRAFDSLQPYLYSMNFGLAGAILVLSALASRSFRASRTVLALIAAAALFGLLSFGFRTPLFESLYAVKPLRHFRYPVKFALPAVLCGSVLVSLAARQAIDAERAPRALRRVSAALAAVLALTFAAAALSPPALTRFFQSQAAGLAAPPEAILAGVVPHGPARLPVRSRGDRHARSLRFGSPPRPARGRFSLRLAALSPSVRSATLRLGSDVPVPAPAAPRESRRRPGPGVGVSDFGVRGREIRNVASLPERRYFGPDRRRPPGDLAPDRSSGRSRLRIRHRSGRLVRISRPRDGGSARHRERGSPQPDLEKRLRSPLPLGSTRAPARLRRARPTAGLRTNGVPLPGGGSRSDHSMRRTRFLPLVALGSDRARRVPRFDPARDAILRGQDRDPPATSGAAPGVSSAIRLSASGLSAQVERLRPGGRRVRGDLLPLLARGRRRSSGRGRDCRRRVLRNSRAGGPPSGRSAVRHPAVPRGKSRVGGVSRRVAHPRRGARVSTAEATDPARPGSVIFPIRRFGRSPFARASRPKTSSGTKSAPRPRQAASSRSNQSR